jgi:hypothetical protein
MRTEKANGADKAAHPPSLVPPEEKQSSTEKVRRTRSSAPRTRNHAAKKAHGHANGSANHAAEADGAASPSSGCVLTNPETRTGSRVNGHDHASSSVPAAPDTPLPPKAGSDDQSGASVAIATASFAAAGADRQAYAELAEGTNGRVQRISSLEDELRVPSEIVVKKHSPGEAPLPADPAEFVEEIHQRVDLFEIWQELLESRDDKIKQRAVEKLTEMRYKGAQSLGEEPPRVVWELAPSRRDP